MKQVLLHKAELKNYRNFEYFSADFTDNINIIIGPNGSGKTNILESVSLLSPGKGLKSAKYEDICKHGGDNWESAFILSSKLGSSEIATNYNNYNKTRALKYNGAKIPAGELANLLNVIWLTPQMEGIFLGPAANRRKFLDRLTYNFFPNHLRNLAKFDYYLQERNKILTEDNWFQNLGLLEKIEENLSKESIIVHSAREDTCRMMQDAINNLNSDFPKAKLGIVGFCDFSNEQNSQERQVFYQELLKQNRKKDGLAGRTLIGPHKIDVIVEYQSRGVEAKYCSTGEQKALLISLILASVNAIMEKSKALPILLLDEVFVHLDDLRREKLFNYIISTNIQTIITATGMEGLEFLEGTANIISL